MGAGEPMDRQIDYSEEIPLDKQRDIKKKGALYALLFLIGFLALMTLYYMYNHKMNTEAFSKAQLHELDAMEASIQNSMKTAASPLLIFHRSESARQLLEQENQLQRDIFTDIFLAIIKEIDVYQQIRLIDEKGMEIVRVDSLNDESYNVVKKEELQDKGDRYYFKETLETPTDTIYLSPLDLNVEKGAIEVPFKPMIRLGKSYRSIDGSISGMMILNVRGKKLLNDIAQLSVHSNDKVFVLNKDGYYLYSEDHDKNFAFMFPDKKDIGFFNDYETVWNKITNKQEIIKSKEGIFYVRKTDYLDPKYYNSNGNSIYLIMFAPLRELSRNDAALNKSVLLSSLFFIPFFSYLGWYIGIMRGRNLVFKEKLEENATRDSLTGLYNHRMIMHLLTQMIGRARRKKEALSIVFIDVNNLKKVNDNFGHKMGDRMIIGAADSLTGSVRSTDLVARLGGDEFLIVLPDCNESNADKLMTRASEVFLNKGIEAMNMPWTMSYGCAKLNETETIYDFIQRADALMYEHKKIMKTKT